MSAGDKPIAIPPFTRFAICRACIVMVATVTVPEGEGRVRRVVVEPDGSPHRYRCNGSRDYRKLRKDEERLAELRAMKARGEAS